MITPSSIQRWGLIRIFALSSFVTIITISVVSGLIYFTFLRDNLLRHEMSISSEFIQSVSLINNPEAYFLGEPNNKRQDLEEYFNHIIGMPDVIGATAYNTRRQIIWSSNPEMIGKTFTDNDELRQALSGIMLYKEGHTDEDAKEEHSSIPDSIKNFIESYLPVWDTGGGNVIGVVEIYKSPRALYKTINEGRVLVLIVSVLSGIVLYGVLFWIVRTAHQLIETQRERIKQATSRAVELNELYLRRIGSDLHDGPAQSLGYALLRLDSLTGDRENQQLQSDTFNKVQNALQDALQEIRNLSAGLIIPELTDLPFQEALLKLIKKHETRTSTRVSHQLKNIPDNIKTSSKICIYRVVQEGLNNAFRHGKGLDQFVELARDGNQLKLVISDAGPGISSDEKTLMNDNHHLGLRGLRERVESLGGSFKVTSHASKPGVQLSVILPLDD